MLDNMHRISTIVFVLLVSIVISLLGLYFYYSEHNIETDNSISIYQIKLEYIQEGLCSNHDDINYNETTQELVTCNDGSSYNINSEAVNNVPLEKIKARIDVYRDYNFEIINE